MFFPITSLAALSHDTANRVSPRGEGTLSLADDDEPSEKTASDWDLTVAVATSTLLLDELSSSRSDVHTM